MSSYGYLEVFRSPLDFEIMRVDSITKHNSTVAITKKEKDNIRTVLEQSTETTAVKISMTRTPMSR